jgi:hypothetical protein
LSDIWRTSSISLTLLGLVIRIALAAIPVNPAAGWQSWRAEHRR